MKARNRIGFFSGVLAVLLLGSCFAVSGQSGKSKFTKLPANVTPETTVLAPQRTGKKTTIVRVSADARLRSLGARYRRGVLVDRRGREIKFFGPRCRGASAGFEADREEAEAQAKELAALEKKFTVIEIACDPRGIGRRTD